MYYEKSQTKVFEDRNQYQMICLDEMVPNNHILKKIEKAIDFSFIHNLTKQYYSQDNGRLCLDTITLFKIPLLDFIMVKIVLELH